LETNHKKTKERERDKGSTTMKKKFNQKNSRERSLEKVHKSGLEILLLRRSGRDGRERITAKLREVSWHPNPSGRGREISK